MDINKVLQNRLKEERLKLGLNQIELADKLGTTNRTISNYENGFREPNIEMLNKLANIFNCSADYLIGRSPHRDYRIETTDVDGETVYFGVLKSAEKLTKEEKIKMATKLLNDANK